MRGRAIRRHHRERVKRNRIKRWLQQNFAPRDGWEERHFRFFVHTATPCSCYMCGNPRRHFGTPTIQELRANQEDVPSA